MEIKIKALAIKKTWIDINSRAIIETAVATIIAVIVPAIMAHTPQSQFVVGPIVNAVLFWVVLRVGVANALFIAVIPSLIALFRGLLPPQAAVMVPFIILGNCAMILTFAFIGTRHGVFRVRPSFAKACPTLSFRRVSVGKYAAFLQVIFASVIKTLVIFLPAWLLLSLPSVVTFMMSWPQLVTTLFGGLIVVFLHKRLTKPDIV